MTPALRQILFSGGGYCAEARAYFAALTSPPDAKYKRDVNALFVALKNANLLSKLDWMMYLGCPTNRAGAMLNMANLAKSGAEFGTMTYTPDRGFLNPSGDTAGITIEAPVGGTNNATVNSVHIGCYINAFAPKDFGGFIVSNGGGQAYIGQNAATAPTEQVASKIGDNTYVPVVTSASSSAYLGFYTSSRTASNAVAYYFNGASVSSAATAQTGGVSAVVRLLASDGGVNMASPNVATQMSFFTMGQGLTAGDVANLNIIITTFLTARAAN